MTKQTKLSMRELDVELRDLQKRYPHLPMPELFALWFQVAGITGDEKVAAESLTGEPHDQGLDAVIVDERANAVFITQSKYRSELLKVAENQNDVLGLTRVANLVRGSDDNYRLFTERLAPRAKDLLTHGRTKIRKHAYRLVLYYATTGSISSGLRKDAESLAREADAEYIFWDGHAIMNLLREYIEGVAPPIPSLDLAVDKDTMVRRDPGIGISAWVVSATGQEVAALYEKAQLKIFNRNIRGFIGDSGVNEQISSSLKAEPQYFWYLNNGVTIVCRGAREETTAGQTVLRIRQPQIINGQQTTRVLAAAGDSADAYVLVRVIEIPEDNIHFEDLISQIVRATNTQNQVKAPDLISNDQYQIRLERDLRNLGYLYMRKRESKAEARRRFGRLFRLITKDDLAQAAAATIYDPQVVRLGKDKLFEGQRYEDIFGKHGAIDLLTRYWLLNRVTKMSKGYPERGYAKWVVMHQAWEDLGTKLARRAQAFRAKCERAKADASNTLDLDKALTAMFRAALAYYRLERGRGPTAVDISSFFKQPNRHVGFKRFWLSPKGETYRRPYDRYWPRYISLLEDE